MPISEEELFALNGVHTLSAGAETVRHGGWMPTPFNCVVPGVREYQADASVPPVTVPEVFLWELVYRALGDKYPPWNWQLTGSCVNGGYNNMLKVLMGVELVTLPQAEAWAEPFTLHTYGLSRYLGFGDQTEGEGSFGTAMARAGSEGGVIFTDDPEVDKPSVCGPAVVYDAPVELKWSSVRNHPAGLKARSKAYTVQYERCRKVEEVNDHLRRRHPLTFAGNWGGRMSGAVKGTSHPVLTMSRRETWNHQQSILGAWLPHPELGPLYYVQNQWWDPGTTKFQMSGNSIWRITQPGVAKPIHGEHPAIGHANWDHPPFPQGGYWVTEADVEYQCRTGEVCAMILFNGATGREVGLGGI